MCALSVGLMFSLFHLSLCSVRSTAGSLILLSLRLPTPSPLAWHTVPCCPPSCFTAGHKAQSLSSFLSHTVCLCQLGALSSCVLVTGSLHLYSSFLHLSAFVILLSLPCIFTFTAFVLPDFLFAHTAAASTLPHSYLSSSILSLHHSIPLSSCSLPAFWTKVLWVWDKPLKWLTWSTLFYSSHFLASKRIKNYN